MRQEKNVQGQLSSLGDHLRPPRNCLQSKLPKSRFSIKCFIRIKINMMGRLLPGKAGCILIFRAMLPALALQVAGLVRPFWSQTRLNRLLLRRLAISLILILDLHLERQVELLASGVKIRRLATISLFKLLLI